MAAVLLFSVVTYIKILSEVDKKLDFESKLLALSPKLLIKRHDILDFTEVNMKSYSMVLQVYDAITEEDKNIQYRKIQVAHDDVRNYVQLVGGEPVIIKPKKDRPILKAVK